MCVETEDSDVTRVLEMLTSACAEHRRLNAGSIQAEYSTNRLDCANTVIIEMVIRSCCVTTVLRLVEVLRLNWEKCFHHQLQIPLIPEPNFEKLYIKSSPLHFRNLAAELQAELQTNEVRQDF